MSRLLFIAHRVPYPPDKGERLRAFHEIKALSSAFEVTVAAPARSRREIDSAKPLAQWARQMIFAPAGVLRTLLAGGLSMLGGGSITEGYFRSTRLRRQVSAAAAEPFDVVMGYCSGVLPLVLETPAKGRVMDLVDVDSAKWSAYAASARGPKRWLYAREAAGVQALELRALDRCDAVLLVSPAEVSLMPHQSPKLLSVSNGVDMDYFSPSAVPAEAIRGLPRPLIVFTGTMNYRPNIEGVCWFVQHVWPELRQHARNLTFAIVGRSPAPAVQRLANVPGVLVTGAVPDVRPYLAAASLAVTPLHIARGIQNKVLEAMAMGLPVVASPCALEGLDLEVGRDALSADRPEQWGQTILGLLSDENRRTALGTSARACVERRYAWSARMAPLVSLCQELSRRNGGPSSEQPIHETR